MYGWRIAMFGLGVLVGAVGTLAITGRSQQIRGGAATILSHGIAAKRKAQEFAECAKENMEDFVAEADQKLQDRQSAHGAQG